MPLTASQFKGRLAELLEIPKKQADEVLWAFEQVMSETVKDADSVAIPGVGKLECVVAPSRKARNPRTGETIMTKPKVNVKFKISKSLKDQAPSLKSKSGKILLEQAEAKQAEREKAKRKRERAAEKGTTVKPAKAKKKTEADLKPKKKKKKSKAGSKRF